MSGLRCDLVRQYTPSVVLFLIEVLSLLSGWFLVPRSWYDGQVTVLAGLGGVVRGLGLLFAFRS